MRRDDDYNYDIVDTGDNSEYYESDQQYNNEEYYNSDYYEDYNNEEYYEEQQSKKPVQSKEKKSARQNLKRHQQVKSGNGKSTRENIKKAAAKTGAPKKEHFLWVKVWISYLISMTMKDRGKIPDNIGDRVLITNNLYITKLYMNTIVQVYELGPNTPETMIEVINTVLRSRGNACIIDVTCKNRPYYYDPKNSGLQSRIRAWENTLNNPFARGSVKERAARCLYTVEQCKAGMPVKHTRMYITIRAKDVMTLNAGEKIVYECLNQMGATYMPAYGTIKENLEYMSLLGNYAPKLKELTPVMTSNQVLSQIAPNCGSYNDDHGTYIGQDVLHGYPFFIDLWNITVARNMYICAPSGVGKTFLVLQIAQSAFENGSALCMMDIKGNEYTALIMAIGGYIVSLRPNSTEYINSWVMHAEDTDDAHAESYFKSRVNFSKQQMIILSGIVEKEELIDFEELLDEFHEALYISYGVNPQNRNSWESSLDLNPYVVYEAFEKYLTPQKMSQYNLKKSLLGTLRMYMSETGSKSYVFKREFEYADIINSPGISFDFGILANENVSDIDQDLFRLKFLYMSELNGQYVTKNYANGRRTFKILEECQIVSDQVLSMYVREYTLRRSQNQDTMLVGNSVQALMSNKLAQPIIENTRGLFVGELTTDARELLEKQFSIEHLDSYLRMPGSNKNLKNSFVFVNNMQDRKLYPIIKAVCPDEYGKSIPKYKVTVPVKEESVMAGK